MGKRSGRGTDDWDEPPGTRRGGKRRKPAPAAEDPFDTGAWGAVADVDPRDAAIVISIGSGRCRLFHHEREFDCTVPAELAVRQKSALAVGDRVVTETLDGVCKLAAVLRRHTVLSRPDPLNPHLQRLIAANIDVVIHVVSVKAPPLRPRLIDRFLIAIQRGGAQAGICVNKVDLLDADERVRELAALDPYRDLGVPVIVCSIKTGGRPVRSSGIVASASRPYSMPLTSGWTSLPASCTSEEQGATPPPRRRCTTSAEAPISLTRPASANSVSGT